MYMYVYTCNYIYIYTHIYVNFHGSSKRADSNRQRWFCIFFSSSA